MSATIRVGIEHREGRFFMARVQHDGGRPLIEGLAEIDAEHLRDHEWLQDSHTVTCVPDREVIIKPLTIPDQAGIDRATIARFEMATSMLDDENAFLYDTLPTTGDKRVLGLIYRREGLARLDELYGLRRDAEATSPSYRVRSAALGLGYLNFCRRETGSLIGLADLSGGGCSLCLVYDGRLVSLGHINLNGCDFSSDEAVKRLAMEAKTIVSFKQASLLSEGVTLPMSTLVLGGDRVDDRMRDIFLTYFPSGVCAPRINSGYLSEDVADDDLSERYLIALGLTVN